MTLQQLIAQYLEGRREDLGMKSLEAYRADLATFEVCFGGDRSVATFEEADVKGWIASLEAKGLSAKSLGRKVAALRGFCKFLLTQGVLSSNPTEEISIPQGPQRRVSRPLDVETMDRLLNYPDVRTPLGCRNAAMMRLMYSGLSVSELLALRVEDVNFDTRCVTVLGKKGRQPRSVPFDEVTTELLRFYVEQIRPHWSASRKELMTLFLSYRETGLARQNVSKFVGAYGRALGLKICPAQIRRSLAVHRAPKTKRELEELQHLLGHVDSHTTLILARASAA